MNYRCHSVTNEIKSTNALSISQFFVQGSYSAVDGDEKKGKWSNFLVRVVCNAVLEYLAAKADFSYNTSKILNRGYW